MVSDFRTAASLVPRGGRHREAPRLAGQSRRDRSRLNTTGSQALGRRSHHRAPSKCARIEWVISTCSGGICCTNSTAKVVDATQTVVAPGPNGALSVCSS